MSDILSLFDKVKNLMQSSKDISKEFVESGELLDFQTAKNRRAVCDQCDLRKGSTCSKCGCLIFIKSSFVATECPKGKW